jgi:hypothetical protein
MKIDQGTLDEFTKLYKEEFGETLTPEEAYDKFLRLLTVVRVVVYPNSIPSIDSGPEHDTLTRVGK